MYRSETALKNRPLCTTEYSSTTNVLHKRRIVQLCEGTSGTRIICTVLDLTASILQNQSRYSIVTALLNYDISSTQHGPPYVLYCENRRSYQIETALKSCYLCTTECSFITNIGHKSHILQRYSYTLEYQFMKYNCVVQLGIELRFIKYVHFR